MKEHTYRDGEHTSWSFAARKNRVGGIELEVDRVRKFEVMIQLSVWIRAAVTWS